MNLLNRALEKLMRVQESYSRDLYKGSVYFAVTGYVNIFAQHKNIFKKKSKEKYWNAKTLTRDQPLLQHTPAINPTI